MTPGKIFSIFPEKKPFKKAPGKILPEIIVDYREKNSLVPASLVKLGADIDFQELKVGDYIVRNVVIERKTVSDFLSSMLNKRLISQLENMKQHENSLLIIEGIEEQELYSEEAGEGIHPNAIRGFLLSILLKHKIPIIFTKNSEDTARYLLVILKKEEQETPLNSKRKSLDRKEQLQFIIEGFPGIGPKNAKKLLKKFKTIKGIANASEEEIGEIVGKKAERISKIINDNY